MDTPSFDLINQGRIAQLARTYWLPSTDSDHQHKPFQAELVERIYLEDMIGFSHRRCMVLELAQYLEFYLWPNFDDTSTRSHVISICAMVNEKARERVPIWQVLYHLHNSYHHNYLCMSCSLRSCSVFWIILVISGSWFIV